MDINIFFQKLIVQSETIRNYLERENISVDPRAMYAYVCNGEFVWEEKKEFLKELLNVAEDAELEEQIRNKLDQNERALEIFKNPENCVYLIKTTNENSCVPSAYADYESAWQTGKCLSTGDFTIYKRRIVEKASNDSKNVQNNPAKEGEAHFRKDGKLKYIHIRNEEDSCQNKRIEDAWYTYPQPFKIGDIVCKPGDDEGIYVIRYISEYNARIHRERLAHEMGYGFNSIDLTCLNRKTGIVSDEWNPEHPYDLEYYPMTAEGEDELAYKVIKAWSEVLKGEEIPLQILLESYFQFRKELELKEEKGKWEECYFTLEIS